MTIQDVVPSKSEDRGINALLENDLAILSVGISTAGAAEMRMASLHPQRQIIATTLDEEGAAYTQRMIDEAGLKCQIEVKVEDVTASMSYSDESFDFIYARLVLHRLSLQQLENALKEIYRVLKKRGRLFIVVRSKECIEAIDGKYDSETRLTSYVFPDGTPYSRYFHDLTSMTEHLTSAGFTIVEKAEYSEQLCWDYKRMRKSELEINLVEVIAQK